MAKDIFERLCRGRPPTEEVNSERTRELQHAQKLLDWLQRWPKPTVWTKDILIYGPRPRDRKSTIDSTTILVEQGWLIPNKQVPELTNWPIARIAEVVEPTDAQRAALDELRAASANAIDMLQSGCPKDLPSIPTGRLAALQSRLQVMLAAVQTVRPALERFYQSLSDEQTARFNAIALADDRDAAGEDRRDLTKLCDQEARGVSDLPIDRIAQAVQPTPVQRSALDDLKDASIKAAEELKVGCPTYQTLTPTGRVEAMEKRLVATLAAAKTFQAPLAKFYNSLNDEQKARFNSLRLASRQRG